MKNTNTNTNTNTKANTPAAPSAWAVFRLVSIAAGVGLLTAALCVPVDTRPRKI